MKSRKHELLDRAMHATIAAIEIYNKPAFRYRMESFCILAINGWELLLKAKWLNENGNKMHSLYVRENRQLSSGKTSKQKIIKRTSLGAPQTKSLLYLARKLAEQNHLGRNAIKNLEALMELRNSFVHFYNRTNGMEFHAQLQAIGIASIRNFRIAITQWFAYDFEKYEFNLMPLSFIELPQSGEAVPLNHIEKGFLDYIASVQKNSEQDDSGYAVAVNIAIKLTRSKKEGPVEVRFTKDPNAPTLSINEENALLKYPWDYKQLTQECREEYEDFKCNSEYHRIRKDIERSSTLCHIRSLDPHSPSSPKKKFYSPRIMEFFDKHYSKA